MQRPANQQLERVKEKTWKLGGLVEAILDGAVSALMERDARAAEETIALDQEIDALEAELREACLRLLPARRSAATDLRYIGTAMKIGTHLEQMADQAVEICQWALKLNEEPQLQAQIDFAGMSRLSRLLLRKALDAFVRQNVALAHEVIAADVEVVGQRRLVLRELFIFMAEDPRKIGSTMSMVSVSRHLERIADHIMKIAELVVFLVEGRNPRQPTNPKTAKEP